MEKTIENIIENSNVGELKKMCDNGYLLTTTHLEKAFELSKPDIIIEIFNHKIKPNTKCFLNVAKNIDYFPDLLGKSKNTNTTNIRDCYILKIDNMTNINDNHLLMMLKNGGYKFTQSDFYILTQKYTFIEDYKKYGLVLDEYIEYLCMEYNFFPYPEIKPPVKNILSHLKYNVTTANFYKILENKFNIKPNENFIVSIMTNEKTKNLKIIEYLIKKYKLIININVFVEIYKNMHNNFNTNPYGEYNLMMLQKFLQIDNFNYDECRLRNNHNYEALYDNLINRIKYPKAIKDFLLSLKLAHKLNNIQNDFTNYESANFSIYNINTIKILCLLLVKYINTEEITEFVQYILKTQNLKLDLECAVILSNSNSLRFFYDFV